MQSSSTEQLNELKTQLIAREGVYTLLPHADYTRPKAAPYAANNGLGGTGAASSNTTPVRVSFAKVHSTEVINANGGAGAGNPFLPTTHYTRLSHSNDGLHLINATNSSGITTGSTAGNVNSNSSSSAYLNHTSDSGEHSHLHANASSDGRPDERIIFNIGREIFIFAFNGLKSADLSKLIDRRTYKASFPTCHDIYANAELRMGQLLIGFNTGQVQFVDLYRSEVNRFFNSERFIEKSKVTCVRWLPQSKRNFLVSYSSGQLYLFKEDLTCGTAVPHYQQFKVGEGFGIYTCKTKSSRNPIFRWSIGEGAIHQFAFSPCGEYLAIVSQDGFLRVFHYDRMELLGRMRSYFGGLLCLDWSHDSKFIVTGGEDDLISVWSTTEKRVIARGQGHKSWVNVVAFDPYMIDYDAADSMDDSDLDEHSLEESIIGRGTEGTYSRKYHSSSRARAPSLAKSKSVSSEFTITSYRIGSVGQDTQLCLWDLTDDVIRQSAHQPVKSRPSLAGNAGNSSTSNLFNTSTVGSGASDCGDSGHGSVDSKVMNGQANSERSNHHNAAHQLFSSLIKSKSDKSGSETGGHTKHHKSFSLSSRSFSDKHSKGASVSSSGKDLVLTNCTGSLGSNHYQNHSSLTVCDPGRLLGTKLCPRLDDIPMLEPHVCKKIAHERLTELIFARDFIAVANQDGKVSLFARPNKSSLKMPTSGNGSIASDLACDDNSAIV